MRGDSKMNDATASTTMKNEQVFALGQRIIDFSDVEVLPAEIRELISSPTTFSDPRVLEYTTKNSAIARILHENPASDRMLRIVYPDTDKHPLTEGLDRFLSRSFSGQALRDRLDICSRWLADHFVSPDFFIGDFGGGSGSYAFETLRIKEPPQRFQWQILDLDAEAVYICRQRASEKNWAGIISAREGNFMSSKSVQEKYDYAILIGVLCGMDHETAIKCLRRIQSHLKPGAEILAATLLMRAFEEDPRTFRLLCNVGGWQLRPKYTSEVTEIFSEAGWRIIDIMSERQGRPGQYAIVHAKIP